MLYGTWGSMTRTELVSQKTKNSVEGTQRSLTILWSDTYWYRYMELVKKIGHACANETQQVSSNDPLLTWMTHLSVVQMIVICLLALFFCVDCDA